MAGYHTTVSDARVAARIIRNPASGAAFFTPMPYHSFLLVLFHEDMTLQGYVA